MADERLSAFFNPLVTDFLRTAKRCCKGGLGNCVFMIIVWYTTLLKCYKQTVHDLLPLCKAKNLENSQVAPKGIERFLSFSSQEQWGMVHWVSHLTFYLQHRIFQQPRYIRGIGIATRSACAPQKNQVLFQENIGSLNSTKLFSLKQLYWCHLSWMHLQVFLVFLFI